MRLAAIFIPSGILPHIFGEEHLGQTINFGGKFIYDFEEDSKGNIYLKSKEENPSYIEGFWLNDILLVSAIVGENGSGKTTILDSFREYHSFCKFIYEDLDIRIHTLENSPILNEVLYYSPFLNISSSNSENNNFWDLSKCRVMIDDTKYENLGMTALLELHNSENLKRWIRFMEIKNLNNLLDKLSLPIFDKIHIKFNSIHFNVYETSENFRPFFEKLKGKISKEKTSREQAIIDKIGLEEFKSKKRGQKIRLELEIISRVISKTQNILEGSGNKYLREGFINENKTVDNNEFKNANSTKEAFYWFLDNAYVQLSNKSKKIYLPAKEIKNLIETTLSFLPENEEIENWTEFNASFSEALNIINAYEAFLLAFKDNFTYDRKALMSFRPYQNLSSGEKGLYDLFSVLNDFNERIKNGIHYYKSDFDNSPKLSDYFLILLDEADLGFHPEWKKRYVNIIQQIIPFIFKNKTIQIIITTHDSLTLSDFLNNNIVYLYKTITGMTELLDHSSKQRPTKTFGANISDLLADSFFVNDGLIGDFAKEKIEETIQWISINSEPKNRNRDYFSKELEYHKNVISIIDEPVVKIKLSEMISELESSNDFQRQILNDEIYFLTKKRDSLI